MKQLRQISLLITSLLLLSSQRADAAPIDTVNVIRTLSGVPYVCCYSMYFTNRHPDSTNVRIQEVRLRIISGRASFEEGSSAPPLRWSLVGQTPTEVQFLSDAASADILPGDTAGTFNVCVRDTGVFRMVWETRTLEGVVSTDTLAYACGDGDCDESFFRTFPSNIAAVVAVDIVNNNPGRDPVNDYHLHPLGSARFNITAPISSPAGWSRSRTRVDTISWFTSSRPLVARTDFAEGFRFTMNTPRDSNYRIEWWTTSFDQLLCRDTVTLRWGLTRRDSVQMLRVADPCCRDLRVRNRHLPTSPLTTIVVRTTTPGARIVDSVGIAAGWTRTGFNIARDSMAWTLAGGLQFDSIALFRNICVDNGGLPSDSVRLKVETWSSGIPVDTFGFDVICPRPLTRCDSAWIVRTDSNASSTRRCVTAAIRNMNSRLSTLTTVTFRFTNPGARRRIVDAQAPPGWTLSTFGDDSVRFTFGALPPNQTSSGFIICLDNNDTNAQDPVSMTWITGDSEGEVCRGVVQFNAVIVPPVIRCDSVWLTSMPAGIANTSCFRLHVVNRNGRSLPVNRVGVAVDFSTNTAFNSAGADAPWSEDHGGFYPSFGISWTGGSIAPDALDSAFTFCLDIQLLQNLPQNVPIRWSTFNGDSLICTGILQATVGETTTQNDSDRVVLLSSLNNEVVCTYGFALENVHRPGSAVDNIVVSVVGGQGHIASVGTAGANSTGWNGQTTSGSTALFSGGSLAPGSTLDTLQIGIDSSNGQPVTLRFESYTGTTLVSTRHIDVTCDVAAAPGAIVTSSVGEAMPNPARDRVSLPFTLNTPAHVSLRMTSTAGAVVVERERRLHPAGKHALELGVGDLPAGVYYVTVEIEGTRTVRRVVLLR